VAAGSNFDDSKKKTTGGRNGYGAKLCNIYSCEFIVETADSSRGLLYKQRFSNNSQVRGKPEIKKLARDGQDFTCISFKPDLARFNMECFDDDIFSLLSKRVYDLAGSSHIIGGTQLDVYLNGNIINIHNFQQVSKLSSM
jgi:DNA topoisomerase-2